MGQLFIVGDSITWGAWDSEGGWAQRLNNELNRKVIESNYELDIMTYGLGISGDSTEEVLQRIETEVDARLDSDSAHAFILAIGTNDSTWLGKEEHHRVEPEEFRSNLQQLVKVMKCFDSKILLVGLLAIDESKTTPIPWSPNKSYLTKYVQEYDRIIKEVAEESSAVYLSVFDLLSPERLSDGLHPDSEGHRLVYESVSAAVKSAGLLED